MKLANKVILITGAGQGIGRALALGVANEGAEVIVTDLNVKGAEETTEMIREMERHSIALKMDVSKSKEVQSIIDQIVTEKGKIDVLINNAGIMGVNELLKTSDQEWYDILNINLSGVFFCCRAVARYMIQSRYGKIINISSVAAKTGGGLLGTSSYAASKAGVLGLTKGIARELAPYNINVNAICPASIDTEMTKKFLSPERRMRSIERIPLGRRGKPEDIVGLVVLLSSDESSFITGATFDVNGGVLMD